MISPHFNFANNASEEKDLRVSSANSRLDISENLHNQSINELNLTGNLSNNSKSRIFLKDDR